MQRELVRPPINQGKFYGLYELYELYEFVWIV